MRNLIIKFWKDECGALIGNEWVYAVTIIVLGSATGLMMMRNAAIHDLAEFGQAVESGYSVPATAFTPGSDIGAEAESDGGF